MRNRIMLASLAVALLAISSSVEAGWLNRGCGCDAKPTCCAPEPSCCGPKMKLGGRLKGLLHRDKCCDKAPKCGMEKTCAAPAPKCGCDADPCCGRRMKLNFSFKGLFKKRGCCDKGCEPKCGAEPKCGMDAKCGAEPSCGCDRPSLLSRFRSRCKSACGKMADCGCNAAPKGGCGW